MTKPFSKRIRESLSYASAGLFCVTVFAAQAVFAAAPAKPGEAPHGAEHASAGLPQFDPATYSSQVFWLTVSFVILYLFFRSQTLPDISTVLENRQEHIQSDLDTAEQLRQEAEQAQEKYESLLENARAEATAMTAGALEAVKEKANKTQQDFRERSAQELDALEKRLQKTKKAAMKDMNEIAAEIAREAAEKIVGIKADLKQAQTVVQSLNGKEAA